MSDPLCSPSGYSDSEARVSGIQPPLRVIFIISEIVVYARVPQGGEKQHLSSPESLVPFPTLLPLSCDFRKTLNHPLAARLFSFTRVDGGCSDMAM